MSGTFRQVKEHVTKHGTNDVVVIGEEYPPPPEKKMLSSIISYASMVFILTVALGDTGLRMAGVEVPSWLLFLSENKLKYCIACQFVVSGFAASLTQTGAFEILVDDVLVFSKLETGKMITAFELHAIFEPYGISFV